MLGLAAEQGSKVGLDGRTERGLRAGHGAEEWAGWKPWSQSQGSDSLLTTSRAGSMSPFAEDEVVQAGEPADRAGADGVHGVGLKVRHDGVRDVRVRVLEVLAVLSYTVHPR